MKKFLTLILALGFVGNALAAGCCGCSRAKSTRGPRVKCTKQVCKEVCVAPQAHTSYSCPTEHAGAPVVQSMAKK